MKGCRVRELGKRECMHGALKLKRIWSGLMILVILESPFLFPVI